MSIQLETQIPGMSSSHKKKTQSKGKSLILNDLQKQQYQHPSQRKYSEDEQEERTESTFPQTQLCSSVVQQQQQQQQYNHNHNIEEIDQSQDFLSYIQMHSNNSNYISKSRIHQNNQCLNNNNNNIIRHSPTDSSSAYERLVIPSVNHNNSANNQPQQQQVMYQQPMQQFSNPQSQRIRSSSQQKQTIQDSASNHDHNDCCPFTRLQEEIVNESNNNIRITQNLTQQQQQQSSASLQYQQHHHHAQQQQQLLQQSSQLASEQSCQGIMIPQGLSSQEPRYVNAAQFKRMMIMRIKRAARDLNRQQQHHQLMPKTNDSSKRTQLQYPSVTVQQSGQNCNTGININNDNTTSAGTAKENQSPTHLDKKKYKYESRHRHANNRIRDSKGRFIPKDKLANYLLQQQIQAQGQMLQETQEIDEIAQIDKNNIMEQNTEQQEQQILTSEQQQQEQK